MSAKASEKLSEVFQAQEFLYSDEEDETTAKFVTQEDELEDGNQHTRSSLRVRNVHMLDDVDERYSGTKVSRQSLQGEGDVSEDEIIEKAEVVSDSEGMEESDEDENSDAEGGSDEEMSADDGEAATSDEDEDEDSSGLLANVSGRDTKEEIAKGRSTQHQLRIFDMLLETRIRLQKILIESNKLPQNEVYNTLVNHSQANDLLLCHPAPCQTSLKLLLDNLMQFQDHLFNTNSETRTAMSKKANSDNDEDKEDESSEVVPKKRTRIEDYSSEISSRFNSFVQFRNDTIHKWNEKTQTLSKNFSSFKTPILKQVEHILKDKERLVKRTQTKRSEYSIIGAEEDNCEEIYDDDDFYHQLLRELIERKTTDVSEPSQLSRHWLELQKLRSKMKRKIDTKASKGRRIRYEVHSKLVNFMAPYDACPMTENAVTELFGSLFGGGRSTNGT